MELVLKDLTKLAPLGVALAIAGIAIVWMLQRQMTLGTWLLAAFLLGHGLVHIMFTAPPPAESNSPAADFAFDPGRSWLATSGLLSTSAVRAIVLVLVVIAVVGYALTAVATVGLFVPATWWTGLLIVSTAASALLMVVALMPGLALGIAIDLVLIWVAMTAAWTPASAATA
jgi:hypothetical protein